MNFKDCKLLGNYLIESTINYKFSYSSPKSFSVKFNSNIFNFLGKNFKESVRNMIFSCSFPI